MSFQWFNEKPKEVIVTLASGNITLNKQASTYFEHAFNVMLGVDAKTQKIAIKPLSKAEAMSHAIPDNKNIRLQFDRHMHVSPTKHLWKKSWHFLD